MTEYMHLYDTSGRTSTSNIFTIIYSEKVSLLLNIAQTMEVHWRLVCLILDIDVKHKYKLQ